jgi:hypothetical protein
MMLTVLDICKDVPLNDNFVYTIFSGRGAELPFPGIDPNPVVLNP